eukprot:CAMPEP_0114499568 /NCGR_PEP_ID=MMETSP0109-20121206/7490_1 /TAXON_ID=29199 /ORGANISM="Chlorarachnion reptans, Strain CCCM449" /LENGTH=230 /DNA_ID=CAMNT_0001677151 /DNA_START=60 /DNA_END=752 /DNA_ORIENTATION=-
MATSRKGTKKRRAAIAKKTSSKRASSEQIKRIKMVRYLARKGANHDVVQPKKRGKKEVDENRPKRARSAYIFFCKEERQKVVKEWEARGEKVKPVEIMGILAERWNKSSRSTKNRYAKMAEEDKIRYEDAKEEAKQYIKPKRARGAYNFFVAAERHTMSKKYKQNEIFAALGKKWKTLSDAAKQDYIDMENDDKERHKHELERWKEATAKQKAAKIAAMEAEAAAKAENG